MAKLGEGNWSLVAAHFPGRIGKQCRERWHHQLHPNINRQAWSHHEEATVVEEHRVRQSRSHCRHRSQGVQCAVPQGERPCMKERSLENLTVSVGGDFCEILSVKCSC